MRCDWNFLSSITALAITFLFSGYTPLAIEISRQRKHRLHPWHKGEHTVHCLIRIHTELSRVSHFHCVFTIICNLYCFAPFIRRLAAHFLCDPTCFRWTDKWTFHPIWVEIALLLSSFVDFFFNSVYHIKTIANASKMQVCKMMSQNDNFWRNYYYKLISHD